MSSSGPRDEKQGGKLFLGAVFSVLASLCAPALAQDNGAGPAGAPSIQLPQVQTPTITNQAPALPQLLVARYPT